MAQSNLGHFYYEGKGLKRDDGAAFQLFQQAADQDFPAGVYNLAICYAAGRGVPKDQSKAAQLYRRAAELGDEDAMHALGQWYRDGTGGLPQDREQARSYLRMAIDAGCSAAGETLAALDGSGAAQPTSKKKKGLLARLFRP